MNRNLKFLIYGLVVLITAVGVWYFVPGTGPAEEEGKIIKLFYYNPLIDQGPGGAQCSRNGLVAVERKISDGGNVIENTINLLLRGELTESEKADGLTTEYPLPGFALQTVEIQSGTLTLTFSDSMNKTGGGSCRVAVLWHQIEATAKQFPEVKEVRFLPEEIFQP